MADKFVDFTTALSSLADTLAQPQKKTFTLKVGGFWEFLRDIWSQSYSNPDLFNEWHVGILAEDLERALDEHKNYCAVVPRFHLKSTILGHAFSVYSFLKYHDEKFDSTGMYLSYSDGMSTYHLSEIKKAIRRNKILNEAMEDRVPNADFSFRYYLGATQSDLLHGGLFSFKRGSHVNRFLVCLAPETLIRTKNFDQKNGSYRQISEIKKGDKVLTHLGRFKTVLEVFSRDITESILEFQLEKIEKSIKITKNHRILTEEGWKRADEIKEGDILVRIKQGGISSEKSRELQSKFIRSKRGKYKYTSESLIRRISRFRNTIDSQKKLGVLIGRKRLQRRTTNCLKCGKVEIISINSKRKFCSVSCATTGKFNSRWNNGSSRLPWGEDFGQKLKEQVREIFNFTCLQCKKTEEDLQNKFHKKLDIHHLDSNKNNNKLSNLVCLCKNCYSQIHARKEAEIFRSKFSNGVKVLKINTIKYSGKVFNLEVDEDNTYTGEKGIVFHNCDDILRDPANPLNYSQLIKIENHFFSETMHIPVGHSITIVLGTPMAPNDLLEKLRNDDRFLYRFLPALNPAPGRRVLCPAIRDEKTLLAEQRANPRAFASEMLLQPYILTDSYFSEDEIEECENPDLKKYNPYEELDLKSDFVVGGLDVGKKRHSSHISVFAFSNGKAIQIFQEFLDGWDYEDQKIYINEIAKNFGIDRGYYDNTRAELEERGVDTVWRPLTFTVKKKMQMAQIFGKYVTNKEVEFIKDERQKSQIICVDGDLKAPETPYGHGDAFFSNALALLALNELVSLGRTSDLGNVQNLLVQGDDPLKKNSIQPLIERLHNMSSSPEVFSCPSCGKKGGWEKKTSVCLLCHYRGGN